MSSTSHLETTIDFIADLPQYACEKPYFIHPTLSQHHGASKDEELSNVKWEEHSVTLRSIRDTPDIRFEETGFCFTTHESSSLNIDGALTIAKYMEETEDLLKSFLGAVYVKCVNYQQKRVNFEDYVETTEMDGRVHIESVARGAHDTVLDAISEEILGHLDEAQQEQYVNESHRFRIVRTWRPINRVLEHRPLAVCDFSSVEAEDLVPTDRVWPSYVQEVYYLKFNPAQSWYWLPFQKSSEPLIVLCYDSHAGSGARYCPFTSVENPQASPTAARRESIETRSIVITQV